MITLVLGLQFGDEGKGKIVDYLSGSADAVIKFNGGSNAGHTVVTEKGKFKFHLIPSGALRSKEVILGNGMTIDPFLLEDEIRDLERVNGGLNLKISSIAHVVTPMHRFLDKAEEGVRGSMKIGTTFQGIGPTYEDKYARTGIRMSDLADRALVRQKIELIYSMKRTLLEGSEFASPETRKDMAERLVASGSNLSGFVCDTDVYINEMADSGKNLLFEGSHGSMLDVDFGTYPYVTSSNTTSGALTTGSGLSLRKVDRIIGVVKAYMSRVGAGPFPTEISGDQAEKVRTLGNEYGTTTGRPRRVGWLDLVLLRYTLMISDVDSIALTRLDTLGEFDEIKVGYSYSVKGKETRKLPRNESDLQAAKVNYRSFQPWGNLSDEEISGFIKNGKESLPQKIKDYIEFISSELGKDIDILSFGDTRSKTLFCSDWATA